MSRKKDYMGKVAKDKAQQVKNLVKSLEENFSVVKQNITDLLILKSRIITVADHLDHHGFALSSSDLEVIAEELSDTIEKLEHLNRSTENAINN